MAEDKKLNNLTDEELKNVSGGDVVSTNVVGYDNPEIKSNVEHRWFCPENNKPYTEFDGNLDGNGHNIEPK